MGEMKFAHLADCHIGGWREPKLKELSIKAFSKAVNSCIDKNMDFILISGDMFDTSLPGIDVLKEVGEISKVKVYEGLDEALSAYRGLHQALEVASEVLYGDEGEAFSYDLHITVIPPYQITAKIFLI